MIKDNAADRQSRSIATGTAPSLIAPPTASPYRKQSHPGAGRRLPAGSSHLASAGLLSSHFMGRGSGLLLMVGGFILISLTALLDYWIGPELSLAIFYLLPIAAGAWWGGFAHGILLSVTSVVAWHVVEAAQLPHVHFGVRLWNGVVRYCFFVITSSLLTRQRAAMRREQALARTDALTGAANGRTFYEVAQLELLRASRTGRPFTVAYFDVDNFKAVNDRLGHSAGDALLRRVAETIRRHIRASDLIARLGGDEFALLLPETASAGAKACLTKLREALLREVGEAEVPVTYSVGAATFVRPPEDVDAMVRRVDALMYGVKRGGKDRIQHEVVDEPTAGAPENPPSNERRAAVRTLCELPVRVVCDADAARRFDFATVRDLSAAGVVLELSHQIDWGTLLTVEPVGGGRARTLLARVVRSERTAGGWFHNCELAHRLSAEELWDWLA
jgi:diguanylate cyclase (GGDEF)-like protein